PESRDPEKPKLDVVGALLSIAGLSAVVWGLIEAPERGWTSTVILGAFAGGAAILAAFAAWERRREEDGADPLLHLRLLRLPSLRGGLAMLLAQNLILMGIFFTVPLFLQIVQGLDALETGVRMLPASAGLFASALLGSRLAKRFPAKTLVRTGIAVVFVAVLLLLDTIEPELDNASFLLGMGILGVGMGLIVSQLGNVVQSAVSDRDRSEAGGLQNTAQQLGSSLGTAFLGAVVLTGLLASFSTNVASNPRLAAEVQAQVQTQISAGSSFVASADVETAAVEAGLDEREVSEVVGNYEDAQLDALRVALLFAALLVLASFFATRNLPGRRFDELSAPD
ncbi:MAG TPA: MFS transporter, partial [Solirubrobacterales bacterium]